ncbi:MAG: flippase-like domain-containing protein [Anaerolineales bacterium]|nr:flippase-like domain-containing protein [Anaerolineales bacterium]
MNTRRFLTLLLSFLITAIFLALALYRVDFEKLAHTFISADYRLIAFAALCWLTGYVVRTARWQKFLAPTKKIPFARLFAPLIIGFAFNNLLPGRPGEFARAYLLGTREGLSKTMALATIVAERVADGIMVIVFLLIALGASIPLRLALPTGVQTLVALAVILFGGAFLGLILLLAREDVALTILRVLTRFLPGALAARIEKMLNAFVVGLHAFKSAGNIVAIGLLSLGVWSLDSLAYFTMLSAFGALPDVSWRAAAAPLMTGIINLGIMIPAAPGGLGPYEAAGVFALSAFGVNQTLAASVALAAHAVQYFMITGLGLFFTWRAGISLAQPQVDD